MQKLAPESVKLLHVVERLSLGGAARALLALATELQSRGGFSNRILSILPPDEKMKERAQEAGITVVVGQTKDEWVRECELADIVQISFWNSPALYEFFTAELPAMRSVVWLMVNCGHAPHAVTKIISDSSDRLVASCQSTQRYVADKIDAVVPATCNFKRLENFSQVSHPGFNVGYIGTVDPVKMHPNFVRMSASIDIPDIKFPVFGGGGGYKALEREAIELGVLPKFDFVGFTEDIGAALSRFDIFGYPLCEDNYSTTDLVIQEALYCGVPPVVFAHGGVGEMVINNQTGFVVNSESEYRDAVQFLFGNPEIRASMAEAGKRYARETFGSARAANSFEKLYAELLRGSKTVHSTGSKLVTGLSGAERFVLSLGNLAPAFSISLYSTDEPLISGADEEILNSSPVLSSAAGGGVLDYARFYRADPYLRLWSGLVLEGQGRLTLAIGEYRESSKLGERSRRAERYLMRALEKLRANQLSHVNGSESSSLSKVIGGR